jgi:hypothetical protein
MHSHASSLFKPPYGLSFPIDELVLVRNWAEARGLCMLVALDQTLDHAEFEEMLIIAPQDRRRRTLTIWRTLGSVFLQAPHGRPHAFATVQDALASIRPAASRRRNAFVRFFSRT